ncbi:MAG: alpha/beta hydrolase fold domain-containing protein, partial [Clostridia bacterium]|nr:alpha/beta hydrolase fold domain-containing protein [Clostridia bacterium]
SPLFGDLSGMPPSLIFAGGDEIMLSDSVLMHEKLVESGVKSKLVVTPERWHGYVVYDLRENRGDFDLINQFLSKNMSAERKLRWMRLDNTAKIYPAARRHNWSNLFRISATLTEEVDRDVLAAALDVTVRRFPSIATRLRRGAFWYYLEQLSSAPKIRDESSYPLVRMSRKETGECAFRILIYKNRIALEVFHALTDGTGAMIFLKTLLAEYLQQKYGISIPNEHGIVSRLEEPLEEEMEDSFLKYTGDIPASRRENDAWRYRGTIEPAGFLHLTCFKIPVSEVLAKAHEYNVSLTVFLCAVMMQAFQQLQNEQIPNIKKRKSIKILLPVNLRSIFDSKTLRNFALYTTPEIETRLGEYSFEEICCIISSHMKLDVTAKQMAKKIAANVSSEKMLILQIAPLFLKNIVMKAVFDAVGERKSCLSLSNLGAVKLPDEMMPYIKRMDLILGTQATAPYNCGVLSFGDTLYINFIRNIRESALERKFHEVLRDMGIRAEVESN